MRARFGQALPAVIVRGSLVSKQEAEAHAHEFHLPLKPVVLRAMIAFKLGQR